MRGRRFQKFVDAWITAEGIDEDAPEYDSNNWAIQLALKWSYRNKPEQLWSLIVAIFDRDINEEVITMVGCSPLEDLLANWGPEYIDRVEELAAKDERFLRSLRCVWGWTSMSRSVWARLIRLTANRYCSFCSRSSDEVTLISSPEASICAICLERLNEHLADPLYVGELDERYECYYCQKKRSQTEKLMRSNGTCICTECMAQMNERMQ
jgi:ClpX C4-type zinc finger